MTEPKAADATTALPLAERIKSLSLRLQFLWFLGHFFTVLFGVFCLPILSSLFGSGWYFWAYYSTIISYLIVIFKAHGTPQISRAYLQRILMDENSQYLFLAILWATSSAIWPTLIPYVCFSMFHAVTFARSEIIPAISPPAENLSLAKKLSQWMATFVEQNQNKALRMTAVIMPYTILTIFFGNTSILTPLLYANFLRFRHFYSPLTKEAIRDLRVKGDELIQDPRVPEFAKNIWKRSTDFLTSLDVSAQATTEAEKDE